ncbi:MAG: tRNA (adenosine(37)-N6)-dimethylallyltransferase MiaA [Candidatus Shikimatogenerans bostrichidophilus]|nr:MAG: tRNA (adenosine(37)-N6)-dimethylallyltransferase MiaA [Candidatus Shikimatogenerans bostrichidophilus]
MNLLVSIIGPTGIGKTNLSIKLANYFNSEIISCDSRQFYKELSIGTSKPNNKQLNIVKHHFIGHKTILDNYTVYNYYIDVYKKMEELYKQYNILFLVGGSLLYEKSIINGINYIPYINRKRLLIYRDKLYKKDNSYLIKKLIKEDYNYYKILKNKKDNRKIIRALEVKYFTKKKLSSYFNENNKKSKPFNKYLRIGLIDSRENIYNRINRKVDDMIKNGLIDEIEKIKQYKELHALNTIGYKEFFQYNNLYKIITTIKKNTRNYAKKQIIWLRKMKDVNWFNPNEFNRIKNKIIYILNNI